MRISKADAEKNRVRIVDAAAKILRERGIAGVGVDALAKAAGLTHGGVYSHFKSKDELAAAAVARAFENSSDEWRALRQNNDADALARLIRAYVSRSHRDNPGSGCSITSLGPDVSRGGKKLRDTAAQGVARLLALIENASGADAAARDTAISNLAAMVGAIVLARTAAANAALSDEILKTVRRDLLARNDADE